MMFIVLARKIFKWVMVGIIMLPIIIMLLMQTALLAVAVVGAFCEAGSSILSRWQTRYGDATTSGLGRVLSWLRKAVPPRQGHV